ncbi:MAG: molybdopterin-dependent oxidoreductase [Saprospiraceae bacterium]|nr:molybdopterin-dependent oxidoreductase [Saprospiraceae bacterium]
MENRNKLNRRSFFKISAVAGGGMVLGFTWLTSCKQREEVIKQLELPSEWYDINAYLKIGNNGVVTIFSPNPEIGQNVKTSMPMIVAEELDIDWNNVLVEQAGLNSDAFRSQVAGGSNSIRTNWETLRKAGATARQMLINAAAKNWEIDPSECTTENGVITGPAGQSTGYGDVASIAASMEIPEEVPLKDKKDFKLIGQTTGKGNVDIDKIVTGKPLFGIDTKREGMQYAVVMRPPAFGQKLVSFDAEESKKVNGVNDVIQFGNKIAVLANGTWPAMKGKSLLSAEWEEETSVESTSDHDEKMIALFDTDKEPMRNDGDVDKAFSEADEVITKVYESPFLPHSCMEPMNFYADVREDEVVMHGPIQTPAWARSRAAKILDRDEKEINVGMSRMGGGFGRRLYGDFSDEAAEISSLAKTPIQLVFTREDDMKAGTYRPAIKYKIEASIKDKKITGYKLSEAAINSNMYGLIPHFFPAGAIPNLRINGDAYQSNITTGAWRAPYTNFLAFAEQSFFDELAEKLGKDEVDLRMELLEKAKPAAEADENIKYSPQRLQDCIQLVTEKSGWGKQSSDVYQGISVYYCHNTHVAEVADVVMKDGYPVIQKVTCAVDCGIVVNPLGARNQIEGGIIDGIGHAMFGNLTFDKGKPSIKNFDSYRMIRNAEAPEIDVHFVDSGFDPTGLGEPSLPPAGGAIANAIYKATGKRMYKQPFVQHTDILG